MTGAFSDGAILFPLLAAVTQKMLWVLGAGVLVDMVSRMSPRAQTTRRGA